MLRSLALWKFVDRTWGAKDLEDIAKFWLRLYDAADHPPYSSRESDQTLELYLTGFMRSATEIVSAELTRRLSDAGLSVTVSADGPDTLVVKTKPREGRLTPFTGLGIHALAGAPFDGLVVEIRYTVAKAGATKPSPKLVGATLVIVGELKSGSVLVKTLWPAWAFVRSKREWTTSHDWPDDLLAAFDRYRTVNKVNWEVAQELFNRPPVIRPAKSTQWLTSVFVTFPSRLGTQLLSPPFGRPRLRGLLVRCAILLVVFAIWAPPTMVAQINKSIWQVHLVLLGFPLAMWACALVHTETRAFFFSGRPTRQDWDDYFRSITRYAALTPSTARPWQNDPIVRKLTAEVLEAGFTYAGDGAAVPTESAGTVHCAFYAPDGATYLVLAFEFVGGSGTSRWSVWPANVSVLCQTFDTMGNRCETTNYNIPLANLKREHPHVRWLILDPNKHPIALYRAHLKAIEQWARETGCTFARHEPFEEYIVRQEDIQRQDRKIYRARPYSWRDHLRWYLQLDEKPSGESG